MPFSPYEGPGYKGVTFFSGQAVGGRPFIEGLVTWEFNERRYSDVALLNRGYVRIKPIEGWSDQGYNEWVRKGEESRDDYSTGHLDEDGYNAVVKVPIGLEDPPEWAEIVWKRHCPSLYAWYMDDREPRPYYIGSVLWIKSDVHVTTIKKEVG